MKDVTLFETDYIKVKRRDGWYDMTSAQDSNEVVAVLLMDGKGRYLVRHENCPPYHIGETEHFSDVALTGMKEVGEIPMYAAIREVEEESGIHPASYVLQDMGWVFTNKQCDMKVHLFLGVVMNQEEIEKMILRGVGDGTKGEEGAYCTWMTKAQIFDSSRCGILYQLLALI